jgi:nucleoside phosphorylase
MKIGIIVAMDKELRQLQQLFCQDNVRVEKCGIGKVNAALAQTCYINQVPFISFRVISDIPLRDTDASQYHDFWNTIADNSFQITKTFVESLY